MSGRERDWLEGFEAKEVQVLDGTPKSWPRSSRSSADAGTKRRRLYINGRFLTQRMTGVQRYAMQIVTGMDRLLGDEVAARQDLDVELLVPRCAAAALLSQPWQRIRVRQVGRLNGHLWEQIELPWYARRGVLFSPGNTGPALMRNQVVTMHDAAVWSVPYAYSLGFRLWYRQLLPRLAASAACVLTVSEFARAELLRHLKVDAAKVHVVAEGADHILDQAQATSVLTRHGLIPQGYVLAVSSLNPSKNFQGLVKAVELLANSSITVAVAGGANPRVFAADGSLNSGYVKHIGYVDDSELRALYENALCFVYPSFYEGFGLPPIEAMTCGCPVIAARAASLPEVCGDAAYYVDPHDPTDIARAMSRVASDPELRAELRAKGKALAARLSWRTSTLGTWAHLYDALDRAQ